MKIAGWYLGSNPVEQLKRGSTAATCAMLRSGEPLPQPLRNAIADRLEGKARGNRGRPPRTLALRHALAIEAYLDTRRSEVASEEELVQRAGFPISAKQLRRVIRQSKKNNAEELAEIELWDRWQRGDRLLPREMKRITLALQSEE